MLEWTVCNNCGKILDNSQTICPSCQSSIGKIHMEYLADQLSNLTFLVKTLDVFKYLCPSVQDLNIISLESLILDDLFKWFSYLGLGDGKITDNELEFINSLLNTSYSKDDILKLSDTKLDKDLPLSFKCLGELDSFAQNLDMSGLNTSYELFNCYKLLGKFFITVDNELNDDVLKLYEKYIKNIEYALKRNGIDLNPSFSSPISIESNVSKFDNIFIDGKIPIGSSKNKNPNENKGNSEDSEDMDNVQITDNESEEETHSLEEYMEELNKLVGLENVKKDVNSLINLVQIRKIREERGIKQPAMSLHLVFSGNPGTGKTTVARLLSKIYHEMGLLSKGHLVETDRSGLVGGYVGQTAIKTQKVIQSALGGILFIDEAYSLASTSENDYGHEAIDTLLKAMEDHRDDLIVIVAGYTKLMDNFLHSNPGLESRFNKFIYFSDYDAKQLYEIFLLMASGANLTLDEGAQKYAKEYFEAMYEHRSSNFANGRAVRNFFEEVITAQANRLAPKKDITDEELNTLTYEDFLIDDED